MSSLESNTTDEQEKKQTQQNEEHDKFRSVGWKALFSFTTRQHLPVLSAAVVFGTIAALTLPALAIMYGLVFRQFAGYGTGKITGKVLLHNASRVCTIMTGISALNWIANSVYFSMFLTFGELQANSARNKIFDALLLREMEWYDTRKSGTAAFLPAVQMQIRDLQLSTSAPLGEAFQFLVLGLGSLGIAFYYSWNLTLVIICPVPLIYIVMAFISKRLSTRAHEQADKLQQALKYLTNAITSIETVKYFNGERFELHRYVAAISRAGSLYKRQASLRSAQIGFMQFVTLGIFVQGFWYGSYLVTAEKKNPGQIVTTFWGALMAVQGITGFLPQFIVMQKGKVAGAQLQALILQISEHDQALTSSGGRKPEKCSGDIEFNKVSFSYPTRPDQPALREATIFFPAGDTTFVVGRSGSGKSTLGQLLIRFYEPREGKVLLDGVALSTLDARWLRENVMLVEQHSVLFNDSIRRNIELARKDETVSGAEVDEAVRFALLESMVKDLPNGLDTLVGMKGDSLSGGQKQRVALARARLRDTPVLVLDESTSALDYITRFAVLEAIRTWRKGKTTIVITHDMTQILPDDYVYILDKAGVVQEGYRKTMEKTEHSPFHTFLENTKDDNDKWDSTSDDSNDDILSLYAAAWTPARTAHEMLFNEPVLTPFFSPVRTSMYRASMLYDKRHSYVPSEFGALSSNAVLDSKGLAKQPPFNILDGVSNENRLSPTTSYARSRLSRQSLRLSRPTSYVEIPIHLDVLDLTKPGHKRFKFRKVSRHRQAVTEEPATLQSLGILEILKTFWPGLNRKARITLIAAVGCAVMHAAATPTFAFLFSRLLSTFYATENRQKLALTYSLSILGVAIIDGMASYGFHFLFDSCAQTWANGLRSEAMKRILMQPREFFDREENSVSRLAECLDNFGEEARNLPGRFVGISIVVVSMIFIAVIWSLITCWKLTLVCLATAPILYVIMSTYNRISGHWETLANEADEKIGEVLHETFVNIRTVRCLVLEEVFRKKFQGATNSALQTGIKRAVYTGALYGINYACVLFISALLFWFGAYVVSTGEFSVTGAIQTFSILLLSVSQINFLGNYIPQVNIARDASSRLLRLARLPQDSHELGGTVQIKTADDIVLKGVRFSYPTRTDEQVLNRISFSIPRGSCIAIVGSSGSGKSTIAALLLKLYKTDASVIPNAADLSISGYNIKTLHTPTLRSRMAMVSQTPVIFPGTIAENIAYGLSPSSPRASLDSVRRAAMAAGVDDFVDSLPSGYQTVVGEGGSGLSGGQAQRIAIARALVRDPDILILDEATSALDVESAGIIRDTIQQLVMQTKNISLWKNGIKSSQTGYGRNMTVIIITHAREMMAIAEHIIMLDKGRLVEEGGFEELERRRGPFSRLLRGIGDNAEQDGASAFVH